MLWSKWWQRGVRWLEGAPFWFRLLLLPATAPAAVGMAAVCLYPRTAAIASGILAAAYAFLLHRGLIDWAEIARSACALYPWLLLCAYLSILGMLGEVGERALDALAPCRSAKAAKNGGSEPS